MHLKVKKTNLISDNEIIKHKHAIKLDIALVISTNHVYTSTTHKRV
ncbi:hypothetical protein DOY81_005552, partial [Sarcophaga bullata]